MSLLFTPTGTRRSFFKAGASLVALPFLESAAAATGMATRSPKRLVFLGGGFGFTKESFYPDQAGRFSDMGLPAGMKPLERHIDDITMVSNLHNPKITDPHAGTAGYLAGSKLKISCDQVAARGFGKAARFPSLVLTNAQNERGHGAGGISLSNGDGGKPIAGIKRPIDLYHQLFSGGSQSPEKLSQMLAHKRSILDVISTNATSIKHRVSTHDKEKMEEYFESVREIELGLQRQAEWADTPKPEAPFGAPASQGLTGFEEIKLMLDLIIVALQTDSTRVSTYRVPTNSLLQSLDITISSHAMSHYKSSQSKRLDSEKRDRKLMEYYAYFIDRLKETEDQYGENLYASTIVSYGTNLRTGHTLKSCPALLSGGSNTNLKHGNHIVLPELTNMSNYWLTIMQQAGMDINQFNDSTGVVSEMTS